MKAFTKPSAPSSMYAKPQHTVKNQARQLFTFIQGVLTPMSEVPTYDWK